MDHAEPSGHDGKITVAVVDDHQLFRQGVEMSLGTHADLAVIADCANGEEALKVIRALKPNVVIMDINLPGLNGIQVVRQIIAEKLPSRVIMLTAYDDVEQILHAMRAGAAAYCAKEVEPDTLVEVIRAVHQGRYVVNDEIFDEAGIEEWMDQGVKNIAGQYYAELADSFAPLSPREMEILQYVTRGMSNKEIAHSLQISHQTVKNHMTSILRKLAVEDRTQAAVFALRRGWVRLQDTGVSPDEEDKEGE
ncbi:MAG: response regulator [Anaerolineae bacterium]